MLKRATFFYTVASSKLSGCSCGCAGNRARIANVPGIGAVVATPSNKAKAKTINGPC